MERQSGIDELTPFSSDKIRAKILRSARILSAAITRTILLPAGVRRSQMTSNLGQVRLSQARLGYCSFSIHITPIDKTKISANQWCRLGLIQTHLYGKCVINGRRDYDITEIDITESDVAEFDITENDITESDITETNIT